MPTAFFAVFWHNVFPYFQGLESPLTTHIFLKVENLAFERNDTVLFQPIDFELNAGVALQLEGVNGSGKTTLFQLMTGIFQPSSGQISYCGQSIDNCRYEYLYDVLYIGHQSAVKAALTVEENLRWMSPENTSYEKISAALDAVGLGEYQKIRCANLSAGQKRRVALARLMTSQATLWFLDEPLTSLDKQGVEMVEQCMSQHLKQGGAIVFSSHQDLAQVKTRSYGLEPYVEVA